MIGGSYGGQIQFATAAVGFQGRHARPAHHVERPALLARAQQHQLHQRRHLCQLQPGHREDRLEPACSSASASSTDCRAPRSTRPATSAAPTSSSRPAGPRPPSTRSATPRASTYQLTDRVSVGHYIDKVKVPTFLIQGENDTLFNLQEATATYRSLKARGVPVTMAWQSWGHSGGTGANTGAAPGELDLTGAAHRGHLPRPAHQELVRPLPQAVGGLDRPRVLLLPRLGGLHRQRCTRPTPAPAATRSGRARPSTSRRPTSSCPSKSSILPGSTSWSNPGLGAPASYTEISGLEGQVALPDGVTTPFDTPGTFGAWTTPAQSKPLTIVGAPTLDVRFESPVVALTQSVGPSGQLQVFAKLYDVAPDGSKTLVHKLISPVRVADVTQPVHIELPAIVHRVDAGHRLQLVLASTDAAYKNAYAVQPVTVRASPLAPATLSLPVVP